MKQFYLIKKTTFITILILVICIMIFTGCGQQSTNTVTEAGSTTVQPLAERLAEAFKQKTPIVDVIIQGGGSSVGITSADNGTVSIGAISRELKSGEPALIAHLLAKDGLAIIVNSKNTVSALTKEQIKNIFSGNITNWKQVGGIDKEIHLVAREEGSGTRDAFITLVMGKNTIAKKAILQPSNGAIRTTVTGDSQAIGFLSLGYINESIKALIIDGIEANKANVKSGTYPISRSLYFVTKEQPVGYVKDFIDFCRSPEGQAIVEQEGYVSIL